MKTVILKVEVPIACFRQSRAREYIETYPVPPPSTVYGMLLSLVGETDRYKHCGTRLAIAMLSKPQKSVVLRKLHRHKATEILDPRNIRPDCQELLIDTQFVVWVNTGMDSAAPSLPERVEQAFLDPSTVNRFGGLSLGESQHLVNSVSLVKSNLFDDKMGLWLVREAYGSFTLPYWVNHVGARGTCWHRYSFQESSLNQPLKHSWTEIQSVQQVDSS